MRNMNGQPSANEKPSIIRPKLLTEGAQYNADRHSDDTGAKTRKCVGLTHFWRLVGQKMHFFLLVKLTHLHIFVSLSDDP